LLSLARLSEASLKRGEALPQAKSRSLKRGLAKAWGAPSLFILKFRIAGAIRIRHSPPNSEPLLRQGGACAGAANPKALPPNLEGASLKRGRVGSFTVYLICTICSQ